MGGLRAAEGAQLALSVAQMAVGSPAQKLMAASIGIVLWLQAWDCLAASSFGRACFLSLSAWQVCPPPAHVFDSYGSRRPAFRITFLGSARAWPYSAVRA